MADVKYNPGQYWTNRDFHTSARLHLQHWLFQSTIGFILHSSIGAKDQPLRIADLGCGNGAWLVEASRLLPSSAELLGFDIASNNFPAAAFLPGNVKLSVQDVLAGELPSELVGSFDVVHIRAFSSIVRNNDPSPIIGNIEKLLKPGGYVQWEETVPSKMVAVAPSSDVDASSCNQMLQIIAAGGKMSGTLFDWLEGLGQHLTNFKEVEVKEIPIPPEYFKAWTENYMIVYEELANMIPPASVVGPNAPLSREIYQAVFGKAVEETSRGVTLHAQYVQTAIARKP